MRKKSKKKISTTDSQERSKRILRFGGIALSVILLNAIMDFIRGMNISALLVLLMAFALSIILMMVYTGNNKAAIAAIVLTMNPVLVIISFAEGLQTGGYLYILPLLFALAFLIGNMQIGFLEMAAWFLITVCSFCTCILFVGKTGIWQNISPALSAKIFGFNSISVICLCALFTYVGIDFERQYKSALLAEKNKVELHLRKIKGQSDHLQQIAFMSAHLTRAPLANILALITLIDIDKFSDSTEKEIIKRIKISGHQLDEVIREIVIKTDIDTAVSNNNQQTEITLNDLSLALVRVRKTK